MPDNQSVSREVYAVIMFADIVGSSKLAKELSLGDYDEMIREYHQLSSEAIDRYCLVEAIFDEMIVKRAYGDEIFVLFYTGENDRSEFLKHILRISILLRTEWIDSEFNKSRSGSEILDIVDIRIGIGGGWLKVRRSVWNQGETPEGLPITETKRIEGCANDKKFNDYPTNILIHGELTQYINLEDISEDIGVRFGESSTVEIDLKGEGKATIAVIPVSDYIELREEYLQKKKEERKSPAIPNEREAYLSYRAGEFDPNNPYHQFNSGNDHYEAGNLDAALAAYRKAIGLKPGLAGAYNNLGIVLDDLYDFDGALEAYREAIELKPDNGDVYYNLG
ncbi:MAG: tetratricopeptide repeat protein, partial [Candidatus Electryoneaceae bacterium]|nr:tetratricopeptide repeat protein [Candidatus Electryoneaceae bacterium]